MISCKIAMIGRVIFFIQFPFLNIENKAEYLKASSLKSLKLLYLVVPFLAPMPLEFICSGRGEFEPQRASDISNQLKRKKDRQNHRKREK